MAIDPLSITASILGLTAAAYRLCEFISDVKDGGKERMKLLREISSLCCTLDALKETVDGSEVETSALITIFNKDGGPIHQCKDIVNTLTKKLKLSSKPAERVGQRLKWNFDKQEVLQAVEQLHRIQATITQALQQAIYAVVEKIQYDGTATLGIVDEQRSNKVRDWLSPSNFAAQQKALYNDHCDGTGSGFLLSKAFNLFKRSTESVMWCRGPSGAGKTYLSSIIVHHLQQTEESAEGREIVLVIYCRYDDPACQIVTNVLGDLLKQCLGSQQLPQNLLTLYQKHTQSGTKPTSEEIAIILAEELKRFQRCRIVIDAIDEFGGCNDRTSLLKALALVRQTPENYTASASLSTARLMNPSEKCHISLLVMSRHVQDVSLALRTTWLDIHEAHPNPRGYMYYDYELLPEKDDIRRYLDWRIENDSSLKSMIAQRPGLNEEVITSIINGSGSMFLLAKLMIDNIVSCLTVKEVKLSLRTVPQGLNVAYDMTMERIYRQGQGRSHRAFEVMKWVMFAQRPLTCAEIEHAVSIEMNSKDIDVDDLTSAANLASLCAGLIIIDRYRCFRFAHQTVPEYLSTSHAYAFDDQRKSIADCCITYIMYDVFSKGPCSNLTEFRDRLLKYPLYDYCSRNWYRHLEVDPTSDRKKTILCFFSSEGHWRSSRQAARSGQTRDEEMLPHARLWGDTMLHHAAYLNAHDVFEDLYEMDRSALNQRSQKGRTPLMRAAVARSLQFAKKLIDARADINMLDNAGHSALYIAVWKRDLPMVDLILSSPSVQVDLTQTDLFGSVTPLYRAASDGNIKIIRRLIEHGADTRLLIGA